MMVIMICIKWYQWWYDHVEFDCLIIMAINFWNSRKQFPSFGLSFTLASTLLFLFILIFVFLLLIAGACHLDYDDLHISDYHDDHDHEQWLSSRVFQVDALQPPPDLPQVPAQQVKHTNTKNTAGATTYLESGCRICKVNLIGVISCQTFQYQNIKFCFSSGICESWWLDSQCSWWAFPVW